MKVSYIFPIIDETTDVEKFFKEFSQTKVYKDNKDNEVFFVVGADDKKNLEYLNSVAIRREEIKIFVSPEKFELKCVYLTFQAIFCCLVTRNAQNLT